MKKYSEFVNLKRENLDDLGEGFFQTGTVATFAAKSRKSGDDAAKRFKNAREALRRKAGESDDTEQRLARIERALDEMLIGFVHLREQLGHAVAVDVSAHMFDADKGVGKQSGKKR